MKVLITGGKGQLGTDLSNTFLENNVDFLAVDVDQADITNLEMFRNVAKEYNPDVIVHCAAFTAVDKAEEEKDLTYKINVLGSRNVATVANELDAKLVYISTDYVFNGEGDSFFEVDAKPEPKSYYGLTKYEGEVEVQKISNKFFIIRISWAFGVHGNNFVKTMLRLSETHESLTVVSDQIGSPTYTWDLAQLINQMIQTEKYGVYHASNEGLCTWAEFAEEIMKNAGRNTKIIPVTTEEYNALAPRPMNSRLSKKALDDNGFDRLPEWKVSLKDMMSKI